MVQTYLEPRGKQIWTGTAVDMVFASALQDGEIFCKATCRGMHSRTCEGASAERGTRELSTEGWLGCWELCGPGEARGRGRRWQEVLECPACCPGAHPIVVNKQEPLSRFKVERWPECGCFRKHTAVEP